MRQKVTQNHKVRLVRQKASECVKKPAVRQKASSASSASSASVRLVRHLVTALLFTPNRCTAGTTDKNN